MTDRSSSDIVERLRNHFGGNFDRDAVKSPTFALLDEAAAEIERLRTALREIARHDGDVFGDIARKALAVSSTG